MNTIDNFQSSINTTGFARPNRFEATVYGPSKVQGDLRKISLHLISVQFPGRNIRTVTNETVYGPTYEMAQGITYAEEINMTFLLSQDHEERKYFNMWQDAIYNPETYDIEYYNNYVGSMYVYQLDRNDARTAGIVIKEIFPKTINAMEFNQGTNNELQTVTIGMAFKEWIPLDITPSNPEGTAIYEPTANGFERPNWSGGDNVLSTIGGIAGSFGFGGVVQAVGRVQNAVRQVRNVQNFFSSINRDPLSAISNISRMPRFRL